MKVSDIICQKIQCSTPVSSENSFVKTLFSRNFCQKKKSEIISTLHCETYPTCRCIHITQPELEVFNADVSLGEVVVEFVFT